jgi:hypothetical protein
VRYYVEAMVDIFKPTEMSVDSAYVKAAVYIEDLEKQVNLSSMFKWISKK